MTQTNQTPVNPARFNIGSNSVRLVVYDQLSRAPFAPFNEKALRRLGEGRDSDGRLAETAIDHTLRMIQRFLAISRAMQVDRINVFATEAVRNAPNGSDLVDGIRERCIPAGGPAPEAITGAIHVRTMEIAEYRILEADDIDLAVEGKSRLGDTVIDSVAIQADLMRSLFDLDAIRALFVSGFRMRYDAMHAITGPYGLRHTRRSLTGSRRRCADRRR